MRYPALLLAVPLCSLDQRCPKLDVLAQLQFGNRLAIGNRFKLQPSGEMRFGRSIGRLECP